MRSCSCNTCNDSGHSAFILRRTKKPILCSSAPAAADANRQKRTRCTKHCAHREHHLCRTLTIHTLITCHPCSRPAAYSGKADHTWHAHTHTLLCMHSVRRTHAHTYIHTQTKETAMLAQRAYIIIFPSAPCDPRSHSLWPSLTGHTADWGVVAGWAPGWQPPKEATQQRVHC